LAQKGLSGVFLRGTQVTDAGILQLVGLEKLRQMDVRDTNVTPVGQKAFRQVRPNVTFLK
jgi:hypothetical protein